MHITTQYASTHVRGGDLVKCNISKRIDGVTIICGDCEMEREGPALGGKGGVGGDAVAKRQQR